MAFKLTKTEVRDLDKLVQEFESAKTALYERLDEIANDWESDFSDKSEKWQEGENGQNAQEKIDAVRSWADELPPAGEPLIDTESLS